MTLTKRLLLPRPPSFIISAALPLALRNAGTKPETTVATSVIIERERQNAGIDRELPPVRRRKWRRLNRARKHIDRPISHQHAGNRSKHSDHQTFSQHLPNESPTCCAERASNRQFFCTQCGAAELHVHHVYARDQQYEDDRSKHRPNCLPQLNASECLQQRLHAGRRKILIGLWIVFGQPPRKRDKFGVHLIESHAWFEPAHHGRRAIVGAKKKCASRNRRELIIKGRPEFLRKWKFKIWRHHADDRRGFAINPNALANDVRIGAEIPSPNLVTKNSDLFRARLVVRGCKIAAYHRRHANDFEKILCDVTRRCNAAECFCRSR